METEEVSNLTRVNMVVGVFQWYSWYYDSAMACSIAESWFDARSGAKYLSFLQSLQTVSGPTQFRVQWVIGAFLSGEKRPVYEVGHSLPSSTEVENASKFSSTPYVFMASTGTTL
jgi:hypothetical protein